MPETAVARSELRQTLRLGPLTIDPPVVLAPMAGVTNAAFRTLCREQGTLRDAHPVRSSGTTRRDASFVRSSVTPGLYVCEMITSRGLVEGDPATLGMLAFDPGETVRSVQLYGVDPVYVSRAATILCEEYAVRHIDLNFGCPVPKVTRKGGGAALPWKRRLLGAILEATVAAAAPYQVPVTVKTRKGIDDGHLTFLDAGRIASDCGCAAISLHARTAAQHYSGAADWDAIGELVAAVDIPVLGNGDIWEAEDALRMIDKSGCAGVVVGRGCLGRPWLFRDLAAAFGVGRADPLPTLGEVAAMMRRHAELLVLYAGEERGCKEFRKHIAWYLKGFAVGSGLRSSLGLVDSLRSLDDLLSRLEGNQPFPTSELGAPRGRQGSPRRVALPDRWLEQRDDRYVDAAAEIGISGG